jgi:hypothetical protein|tara:strand:+ start:121 stop:921 length:801 start_codon:yes stop_codon:yes gene_type:complete
MTTHFSSGVTNVRGKDGATSLFSGIKQPLITGGTSPQEWAFQDDFVKFSQVTTAPWTITDPGGTAYMLAQYPQGWLRMGDASPVAADIAIAASEDVFQINTNKKWYFETSIAITDVTELNTFVGFAANAYANPNAVPDDGIGFSHLEDTTSIQFVSRKNGAGTSFTMLEAGSTFAQLDSTVATQSATVYGMPDNSVRLGFLFQPAGTELGQTADQFKLYINGTISGTQAATTIPDDLLMEMKLMTESKGTVTNDLYVDYVQSIQQR